SLYGVIDSSAGGCRGYRMLRIDEIFDQRLLKEQRIGRNVRHLRPNVATDLDVVAAQRRRAARQRPCEHAVEAQLVPGHALRSSEHEKVPHDLRGPVSFLIDTPESGADGA